MGKQVRLSATDLSLSGVTLAAERTSATFDLRGADQITVFVVQTAHSAATRIDCNLDLSDEPMENGATTSNWCQTMSAAISAGTATMTELDPQNAVTGVEKATFHFSDVNALRGQVRVSATSGAAGDTANVSVLIKKGCNC